ncbi:MAG: pirin [Cyclobacteriaceae bacterium]|nr:pirin [Cyclobacteriaceae bacterium]
MASSATIYLADQRGRTQSDWLRSFHIFNFGDYFKESKKSFGNLIAFNDDTLKGGSTLSFEIKEPTEITLIPIVGSVEYKTNEGKADTVEVGQSVVLSLRKNTILEISNPYENDLINFLHLWQKQDQPSGKIRKSEFDLENNRDKLQIIGINSFIGKFSGRKDSSYKLSQQDKGVFVFILEGAFEVQDRLLQTRDGLALWNTKEIDFEALSDNAIISIFEVDIV